MEGNVSFDYSRSKQTGHTESYTDEVCAWLTSVKIDQRYGSKSCVIRRNSCLRFIPGFWNGF
ncbi:hypothetical protein KIN20_018929 [Parelaphostrongylus tenuis]|uniref:Uncharacterized protein n=1 Tax=Parelaphostrongylus tenuis TaxID=148309 RepID=A0AAD5N4T8_PARTN|nr:hypothetical protein KIN20_018929 [Parelaphostrongylus tenuis]